MKKVRQTLFLLLIIAIAPLLRAQRASPCDGVDRSVPQSSKAEWERAIAGQLHSQKVDLLGSFRFQGWSILYEDSHDRDEGFLFYSHDPANSMYVTIWGGAATIEEERGIRGWAIKNAPGIPHKLAGCFAWYVTKGR